MKNMANGPQENWSAERVKGLTMSRIASRGDARGAGKRPLFKAAVSLGTAAAAAICLMALGGALLFPQGSDANVFEIKAYAVEQQEDGSIESREVGLLDDTHVWSFDDDGENSYINLWLKCGGENIESVDFSVDEGFFAAQYIEREDGQIVTYGVPMTGIGSTIVRYGDEYVNLGNQFAIDVVEVTEDMLVFWGHESKREGNDLNLPSELTIRAVATFNDGKTQEETLVIDLSQGEMQGPGLGTFKLTDEEVAQGRAEALRLGEILHRIPLGQCEVVPGSKQELAYGDTFEYEIHSASGIAGTAMYPISEESMDPANNWSSERDGLKGLFDEDGVARFGSSDNLFNLWDEYDGGDGYDGGDEYDGGDAYIAAIEPNGDGTFTGKTYKVPGWLLLECIDSLR